MWYLRSKHIPAIVIHDGNTLRTFDSKEAAEAYLIGRIVAGLSYQGEWEAEEARFSG